MPLPEITYSQTAAGVIVPEQWVPSNGTIATYQKFHDEHGFFDAHAPELHIPTTEVPVDEIGSDVIQQAGRYLLQKADELELGFGQGITANQLAIPGIKGPVPSLSLMSVDEKLQVIVNPTVTLPEGFSPNGEDDLWSQGCLNLLGYGGFVNSPPALGLEGRTLSGKKIDIAVTNNLEVRNVFHEDRHAQGKLYGELVFDAQAQWGTNVPADRKMYVIPPERFAQYAAYIRGKDSGGFVPQEMSRTQYDALLNPHNTHMKLSNFVITHA